MSTVTSPSTCVPAERGDGGTEKPTRGAEGSEPTAASSRGKGASRAAAPRRGALVVLLRPALLVALRCAGGRRRRRLARRSPPPPLQSPPADVAPPEGSGSFTPAPTPEPVPSSTYPPGTGGRVYAENCSGCHGAAGRGPRRPAARRRPASPASSAPMVERGRHQHAAVRRRAERRRTWTPSSDFVAAELADPDARTAQVAPGGDLFRLYCSGCHSATGSGGAHAEPSTTRPTSASTRAAEALAAMILGRGNMPAFAGNTFDVRQQAAVAPLRAGARRPAVAGRRRARLPRARARGRRRRRRAPAPHPHRRLARLAVAKGRRRERRRRTRPGASAAPDRRGRSASGITATIGGAVVFAVCFVRRTRATPGSAARSPSRCSASASRSPSGAATWPATRSSPAGTRCRPTTATGRPRSRRSSTSTRRCSPAAASSSSSWSSASACSPSARSCCSARSARGRATASSPRAGARAAGSSTSDGEPVTARRPRHRRLPRRLPRGRRPTKADSQVVLLHFVNGEFTPPAGPRDLEPRGLRRLLARLHARRLPGGPVRRRRPGAALPVPPVDVRRAARRGADRRPGRPAAAAAAAGHRRRRRTSTRRATSPSPSAPASGTPR